MSLWHVHLEPLVRFGHIGHRLYIMREEGFDGKFSVMTNATFKTREPNESVGYEDALIDDSVGLRYLDVRSFLQAMSDAAWEIGIKPKQVEGHTDELKAVRYHLEDMRKLALQRESFICPPDLKWPGETK